LHYHIVSFNHKSCALKTRESIAFNDENDIVNFLKLLLEFDFIIEAFVINTCNRVEIVTVTKDNFATYHTILGILSKYKNANFYELESSAQRFDDKDAIEHFFRVVSSLDSLVIGDAQIPGQVKDAFRIAFKHGFVGKELNKLLNYASKCAAEVRTNTDISNRPISIASVAVAQAQELLGSLSGMVGVVIGTGEMGIIATKQLLRNGADVLLVSRNKEKTKKIAQELGENVKVGDINNLKKYINKYRLLFSATSSPTPIITKNMVEDVKIDRTWFDMAIPRDIDENIKNENIKIYYIDDLKEISKQNYALRQEQAFLAEEIVKKYKEEFLLWLQQLSVEPVIKDIRLQIKDIVEYEVNRAIKKGFIPKEYKDNIKYLVNQSFDKFLHNPTKILRDISKENKAYEKIEAIKEIFSVNTDNIDQSKYKG